MFKVTSSDSFVLEGRGYAYIIQSPVKCHRDFESFMMAIGGEIEIDGRSETPSGIEMCMPSSPIHVGEGIAIFIDRRKYD